MSKLTGLSMPFKLSFKPEDFVTNKGAEILNNPSSFPNSLWKVSRIYLIASCVCMTDNTGS